MLHIILLSLGLSADAATISVGIGCSKPHLERRKSLLISTSFGLSQAIMPIIGALMGTILYNTVSQYSKFIVFAILCLIGLKTLYEGIKKEESCQVHKDITLRYLIPLAIATSIDALAIGFVLPMLKINILVSCSLIGIITFIICSIALKLGKAVGCRVKNYSEIIGGTLLIAISIATLIKM